MKTALIVAAIVIIAVVIGAVAVVSWAIRKVDEIGEDEERR